MTGTHVFYRSTLIDQRSSWTLNGRSSRPSLSTPRHFQDERSLVDDRRSVTVSGESIVTTLKSILFVRPLVSLTLETRKTSRRLSKRHFKSDNSFLGDEIASVPFFAPCPKVLQASSWRTRDGRRLPGHSRATAIARTIVRTTGSRLTLWRKLAGCDWPTGP